MNFRQLRYFVAIVEAGSLSRAAERVHVAQSALSLHVRRLEERLGVALLVRGAKGVQPTAAGAKLVQHARTILGQLSRAEQELRSARGEPTGAVSIGIPSGVGRLLNLELLDACRHELPQVSLRVVEVLPAHVTEWLASALIQLGIFYEIGEAVEGACLAEEELYLVSGAPEPGLADRVAFGDLPRFPLILPTCAHNPRQCVVTRAEALGLALKVEARVDSLATILDLVRTRRGRTVLTPVAFLPEWRAGTLFAYRIEPVLKRSVVLAIGPASAGDPAVHAVEAMVRRKAGALVAEGGWPQRLPVATSAA